MKKIAMVSLLCMVLLQCMACQSKAPVQTSTEQTESTASCKLSGWEEYAKELTALAQTYGDEKQLAELTYQRTLWNLAGERTVLARGIPNNAGKEETCFLLCFADSEIKWDYAWARPVGAEQPERVAEILLQHMNEHQEIYDVLPAEADVISQKAALQAAMMYHLDQAETVSDDFRAYIEVGPAFYEKRIAVFLGGMLDSTDQDNHEEQALQNVCMVAVEPKSKQLLSPEFAAFFEKYATEGGQNIEMLAFWNHSNDGWGCSWIGTIQ